MDSSTWRPSLKLDLYFSLLNQMWRFISGPMTLVLIPLLLPMEIQGYWFTISSLAALSMLADLGFSNIIIQFSAHEFAHLSINKEGIIQGPNYYLTRLGSLLLFCIKWVIFIVVLLFPLILLIGLLVFTNKNSSSVDWLFPWILYMIGSMVNFFNSSILCFFEGCNMIGKSQNIRFKTSVVSAICMWLLLLCGADLFALAISQLLGSIIGIIFIFNAYGKFIRYLIDKAKNVQIKWLRSFLQLLWKYAIIWISGYLILQIYTPLVFHYKGAAVAGKVGLSINLWTAVFSVSSIWLNIIIPKLNMNVSKKQWWEMEKTYKRHFFLSISTYLSITIFIITIYFFFKDRIFIFEKFVDFISILLLATSWLFQLILNSMAQYLRSFKEEPFLIPSIVTSVYTLITTFLCIRYLPNYIMFLGLASSYLIAIPWCINIYLNKKKSRDNLNTIIALGDLK